MAFKTGTTTVIGNGQQLNNIASINATTEAAILDAIGVIGIGQTWIAFTFQSDRVNGTTYTNSTGRPIQWNIRGSTGGSVQLSSNGSTWLTLGILGSPGAFETVFNPVIPDGWRYRTTGGNTGAGTTSWLELR